MREFQRPHPEFSACGLNCGLCPRYYTAGDSRCPGCAGEGFFAKHPTCGILSCCIRKNIDGCYQCEAYPCAKYDGADRWDSFITHKNRFRDLLQAKEAGAAPAVLSEKMSLLRRLLEQWNDGRRKSFYCTAVNLLSAEGTAAVLDRLEHEVPPQTPKERAALAVRLLEAQAQLECVDIKLRKK